MSYTYQSIDFDDVESVKFNGNDVESIKFNGTKIWEKQQYPLFYTIFGNNSWATIAQISQQIASQNMNESQIYTIYGWQIGDKKSIKLSTGEIIEAQIIGFNHDTLSSDHTSKAGITLQMFNCLNTLYKMNNTNTNAGGWNASEMRTTTLLAIKATLPNDLKNVIKFVDKVTANGGGSGTLNVIGGNYSADVTSSDDLFLLSGKEVFGNSAYDVQSNNEGSRYAYWLNTNNSRIKRYTENLTPITWWLRSPTKSKKTGFSSIAAVGNMSISAQGATKTYGISFAFCV